MPSIVSARLPLILALSAVVVLGAGYTAWRMSTVSPAPAAPSTEASPAAPAPATSPDETALAPLPPPLPPLPDVPLRLPGTTGDIEIQLGTGVTPTHEVVGAEPAFDDAAEALYAGARSTLAENVEVSVVWRRLATDVVPAAELGTGNLTLAPGARGSVRLPRPAGGWLPGDYELEAAAGDTLPRTRRFRIAATLTPARLVATSEGVPGLNVALAALGGRVATASNTPEDDRWAADNLIDGFPFLLGADASCARCGWSSEGQAFPHEIVLALAGDRPLTIDRVVVDPATETTSREGWALVPRGVEVWVSTTSETSGFTRVSSAQLAPRPAEQLLSFSPVPARWVKLRLLSNWGGPTTELGEVKVLEADGHAGLEEPPNLARPALGGVIARYTSQASPDNGVHRLVDDQVGRPWSSRDRTLPQDIVFAFKDDRRALVDRVELVLEGDPSPNWPRRLLLSVSDDSLFTFDDVATMDLPQAAGTHAVAVKREARFLRLRIVENHGGTVTSVDEVRVVEGSPNGYVSVLRRGPAAGRAGAAHAAANLPAADQDEVEPNDEVATANRIQPNQMVAGRIDPSGDADMLALEVPGPGRQALTLTLGGEPFVKTSVTLLDLAGQELRRFDPAQATSATSTFSWLVEPGPRFLRLSEPPTSIVLVWDTSRGMEASSARLREAVLSYLDQVQPSERVNLVAFSDEVAVLLDAFTNDRQALKAAAGATRVRPAAGARLHDAIGRARALLKEVTGNRAIILMTGGEGSGSSLSAPALWEEFATDGIRFYAIGLGPSLRALAESGSTTGQRFLAHAARASHGRAFFAGDPGELAGVYSRIAAELRPAARYSLRPTLSVATGRVAVDATGERIASLAAPSQVSLVLDASASMNRALGGKRMIDTAKDVLAAIVDRLPDRAQVGLRVYGSRLAEGQPGACEDSELVQPMARLDRARLTTRIRNLTAQGTTPIAYSLAQIGRDLEDVPGQHLVVLVADGDDACGGDPRTEVAALQALGLDIHINVVGFALSDATARQQLTEAAALTGGVYFDAQDGRGLQEAIEQAMAVPFEVQDASGAAVAAGQVGRGAAIAPEGVYTVVVRSADGPIRIPDVRVQAARESRVELRKEGREVGVRVNQP